MGLKAGIPITVGAFDAHWDAIGAGCREGDVVNVVGDLDVHYRDGGRRRSLYREFAASFRGVCIRNLRESRQGFRLRAISSKLLRSGRERMCGRLSQGLDEYEPGQTGLLRLSWDNGDRTVLVNPELGGMTIGWNLLHTAKDELFAAIEGTAFHTRIILERMAEHGVPVHRVINAGGIPQNNACAEPGLCGRAGQACACAGWRADEPRVRDFCAGCGGRGFRRLKKHRRRCAYRSRCTSRRPKADGSRYEELYKLYRGCLLRIWEARELRLWSDGRCVARSCGRIAAAVRTE